MDPNFCKPLPPPPTYTSAENTPLTLSLSTAPAILKKNRASTQMVPRTRRQKRASFINLRHLYKRPTSQACISSEHYASEKNHQRAGLGLGLGINDSSEVQNEEKSTTEPTKTRRNAAQWIEEKIWRYTSTGSIVRRWTLEILSWSISAACMCAIIVILILLENKAVPQWPLAQTFNMLSRVASAALILPVSEALGQLKWNWFTKKSKEVWDFEIFDNASRGPLGSALLLIRTKGKTLASLGAAVTLLALALDPFFQQVLDFPQRWRTTTTGSIPRVTWYEPQARGIYMDDNGDRIITDPGLRPVVDLFAYANGTQPVPFGNGTRTEIPLTCPTSKCSWPPYQTLGFCSSCQQVSDLLTFSCQTLPDDWTLGHMLSAEGPTANGTMCGYFLNATSSNPVLMSGYMVHTNSSKKGEALLVRTLPLSTEPDKRQLYGGSIRFANIRNPVTDFLIASASDGATSVYKNEVPVLRECVLHWCVQTMNSWYHDGTYKEEVIETYANMTPGPWPWETFRVNDTQGNYVMQTYVPNITIEAPVPTNASVNSPKLLFGLSNYTAVSVIDTFREFIPSYLTVSNQSATPRLRENYWGPDRYSRDVPQFRWMANDNITHHMSRLATAMTNVIRSSNSNEMITGPAYNIEVYVSVAWAWLTLPLLILILSAVFLIGTVMKTSQDKDQVGVWKTSTMATLMYGGLPVDVHEQLKQDSNSIGTPRTKAKRFKARLLPKQGWRVSGTQFSPALAEQSRSTRPSEWV